MKKARMIFAAAAFCALALGSCQTFTAPHSSDLSFPVGQQYKILGRTTVESSRTNSGYMKLLEAAKKQYPSCDDVVNVVIDAKVITFFGYFFSSHFTMSGIAVDYLE